MAIHKKPKFPRLCPKGKTYTDTWTFKDKHGEIIDRTGWTARIEIRSEIPGTDAEPADASVLVTLTTENGGITINGGTVHITIDAETTADFAVGSYVWDLELIRPGDGFIPYIMEPSSFKVTPEVTLNV
jgi:hypothetical protein